jgi:DNA repair ATPase RecN
VLSKREKIAKLSRRIAICATTLRQCDDKIVECDERLDAVESRMRRLRRQRLQEKTKDARAEIVATLKGVTIELRTLEQRRKDVIADRQEFRINLEELKKAS